MPDAARWFGGEPAPPLPPNLEALAADLQARADRAFAVLSHVARHGHDDGMDEPCVQEEES